MEDQGKPDACRSNYQYPADVKPVTLSTSLWNGSPRFSSIYVHMVEAGKPRQLETVLERLAEYFEREFMLRKKIIGALAYPLVIAVVAVVAVVLVMVLIMPTFVKMFMDAGIELPAPTKILIAVSNFLGAYWYVLLLLWWRQVPASIFTGRPSQGRMTIDQFLYRMKIIGPVVQKTVVARFTVSWPPSSTAGS